jgi:hypothetical protein
MESKMRSIAEQSGGELGGPISVLTRQRRDHVRLAGYLEALSHSAGTEQQRVLLSIYRLVFPHAFAEEALLWPVIRRVLPDGEELTLRVEREHQAINELVRLMESMPAGSAGRQAALERMDELLVEDVRDEEDLLLPRLQAAMSPWQLRLLGVSWEVVRRIAPTRPHPIVSRRPPGNILSALPLSVLDRLRDRIDAASLNGTGSAAPALRTVGAALGRASHAVERAPGFKLGEDQDTRVSDGSRGRYRSLTLASLAALAVGATIMAQQRRTVRSA